jgi:hypothetical protein
MAMFLIFFNCSFTNPYKNKAQIWCYLEENTMEFDGRIEAFIKLF